MLKNAPHSADEVTADEWKHPYTREQAAFPLPFVRANKFWPAVARVNGVLTVPLTLRQRAIDREVDDLNRRILLGVLTFILVGSALGYWMAERIADQGPHRVICDYIAGMTDSFCSDAHQHCAGDLKSQI